MKDSILKIIKELDPNLLSVLGLSFTILGVLFSITVLIIRLVKMKRNKKVKRKIKKMLINVQHGLFNESLEEITVILEEKNNKIITIMCHYLRATIYHRLSNNTEDTVEYLNKALAELNFIKSEYYEKKFLLFDRRSKKEYRLALHTATAHAFNDLSYLENFESNIMRSIESSMLVDTFLTKEKSKFFRGINESNYGMSYNHLYSIKNDKEFLLKAIEYNENSLKLFLELDKSNPEIRDNIARVQNNLGNSYQSKNIYDNDVSLLDKAISLYLESLQYYTLQLYPFEHARGCGNIGNAYMTKYRQSKESELIEKALRNCKIALAYFEKNGTSHQKHLQLFNISLIYDEAYYESEDKEHLILAYNAIEDSIESFEKIKKGNVFVKGYRKKLVYEFQLIVKFDRFDNYRSFVNSYDKVLHSYEHDKEKEKQISITEDLLMKVELAMYNYNKKENHIKKAYELSLRVHLSFNDLIQLNVTLNTLLDVAEACQNNYRIESIINSIIDGFNAQERPTEIDMKIVQDGGNICAVLLDMIDYLKFNGKSNSWCKSMNIKVENALSNISGMENVRFDLSPEEINELMATRT
jgi:hypothetical protein